MPFVVFVLFNLIFAGNLHDLAYPPDMAVTSTIATSNFAMDCLWGFKCDSSGSKTSRNYHTSPQSDFGRVNGWSQMGLSQDSQGIEALIITYTSFYIADSGAEKAFNDFGMYLWTYRVSPKYKYGNFEEKIYRFNPAHGYKYIAIAAYGGKEEVESIGLYQTNQSSTSTFIQKQITELMGR